MTKTKRIKIKESMLPAIMSEQVLARDWNTNEEEKTWKSLEKTKAKK